MPAPPPRPPKGRGNKPQPPGPGAPRAPAPGAPASRGTDVSRPNLQRPPSKAGPPSSKTGAPPQKPGASGKAGAAADTSRPDLKRPESRASALEAGKALQRLLAEAPGAHAVRPIAGQAGAAVERALSEAATLELHVPVIPPPAAWEVQARIDELALHHGRVEARRAGEPIAPGDEAELDITGYVGGKTFLTAPPTWYDVAPNAHLPGLFEGLVGVGVGTQALVTIQLPPDYPGDGLGGKKAVFAVDVRAATSRKPLQVGSPEFFERVDLGKTMADVKKAVEQELLQERANAMVDIAKALFLRELYVRCKDDDVPQQLVDEELYKRWRAAKGDAMIRQGLPLEEQRASQQQFAADETERFEARRTVWEMRMLEALAEQAGVHVDEDELLKVLAPAASAAGVRRVDVEAMLRKNETMRRGLLRNMKIDRAVGIVLSRGKIFFDGPNVAAPAGEAPRPPGRATGAKPGDGPKRALSSPPRRT